MGTAHRIFQNLYRDSVALMLLSKRVAARDGIDQAAAVMATDANLDLLLESELLSAAPSSGPNDPVGFIDFTPHSQPHFMWDVVGRQWTKWDNRFA